MENSSAPTSTSSRLGERADDYAQREPVKAVVTAFGAGLLLNMLPIGGIVAALMAIAFALVRPALLFLGLIKACELCGMNAATSEPGNPPAQADGSSNQS